MYSNSKTTYLYKHAHNYSLDIFIGGRGGGKNSQCTHVTVVECSGSGVELRTQLEFTQLYK